MALSDPQSITIGAATHTLPRISTGENTSTYRKAEGDVSLKVSHSYGKRTRRAIRIDLSKIAVDPLIPTVNVPYSMSITLVVDTPTVGYDNASQEAAVAGLCAYLTANSGAVVAEFIGGES